MFFSIKKNYKVNKLHEIAMAVLHDKTNDLFAETHSKNSYVTIHVKNIPKFMTEIFKYVNGLLPHIMN